MYAKRSRFLTIMLTLGLAFFYIPMILLVIYTFNYSKLVPVWGGWSLRWYKELFQSAEVWSAVSLSLQIAVVNATFATALGTLAGLAMVRFGRFKGDLVRWHVGRALGDARGDNRIVLAGFLHLAEPADRMAC